MNLGCKPSYLITSQLWSRITSKLPDVHYSRASMKPKYANAAYTYFLPVRFKVSTQLQYFLSDWNHDHLSEIETGNFIWSQLRTAFTQFPWLLCSLSVSVFSQNNAGWKIIEGIYFHYESECNGSLYVYPRFMAISQMVTSGPHFGCFTTKYRSSRLGSS